MYNLPIYDGAKGEAPRKGAFYHPGKGENLSRIAKAVYGDSSAWKNINMNAWNRDNLVYRADSATCVSPKRDSALAMNTLSPTPGAKSAYIALCPRDASPYTQAFGFEYPVLWLPDPAGMIVPSKPSNQPKQVIDRGQIKITIPTTPQGGGGDDVVVPGGDDDPSAPDIYNPPKKTVPAEAGMSPWLLVGFGVVALVGLLMMKSKKGKK
jgi:hypothetical protein